MKKTVVLMLTILLAVSVAACGKSENKGTAKDETEGKTAVDILSDIWAAYDEEEKFAVAGGDYEHTVQEKPGMMNPEDGETMDALLGFPADCTDRIDDGASMMHMLNQNTFTAGAYHLINGEDLQKTADDVLENIRHRQWICGFPEELLIYSVGENFLITVFGAEENIDNFEDHLQEVYESAVLLYEEDLTF